MASQVTHHIAAKDMYAITAFGYNFPHYYPDSDNNEKINTVLALDGHRKYDTLLRNMDIAEQKKIQFEYSLIDSKEMTTPQKIRQTMTYTSAAVALFSSVVFLGSWIVGANAPFGSAADKGAWKIMKSSLITMIGGTVWSNVGIGLGDSDPYEKEKKEGIEYTDAPRYIRLIQKIETLKKSLEKHDKSGLAYQQQEKALRFFESVVKEYDVYHPTK